MGRVPRIGSGLRTRATVAFGVTGFVVAVVAASVTYTSTRNYLLSQREETAAHQAYVNARLARSVLRVSTPDVRAFLASLGGGETSQSVLRYRGESFATSVATGPDELPRDLVRVVGRGHAARQRYRGANGLQLAVGVPVRAVDAEYYELFSFAELDRTLSFLAKALAFGVAGAALMAALVGRIAANRLVRPLRPVADAAQRIAAGELDTRLEEDRDPDLRKLTMAFNTMAAALESRVEREARFAADVSHELRSPLTAVTSAIEIIERRRDQLPPQVIEAFTVLSSKVDLFRQMVLDLLEISRIDSGTAENAHDLIDVQHLLGRVLDLHGAGDVGVEFLSGAPTSIRGDRRRLAQALGNIASNAKLYAGGLTHVSVASPRPGWISIILDDSGPGVAPEEREAIFGRFARGNAGVAAGTSSGSGLGLALTGEHIRLHGGRLWVDEAPTGGARFVVELPVGEP